MDKQDVDAYVNLVAEHFIYYEKQKHNIVLSKEEALLKAWSQYIHEMKGDGRPRFSNIELMMSPEQLYQFVRDKNAARVQRFLKSFNMKIFLIAAILFVSCRCEKPQTTHKPITYLRDR
jgi:hypothetical protein